MKQRCYRSKKIAAARRPLRWHIVGVWFGIFTFILQALIPFGQGIPVPNSGDGSFEQALLFHCKVMKAGTDPATPQPASGQDEDCIVCIASVIGHCLIPPPTLAGSFSDALALTILYEPKTDFAAGNSPTLTVARSPPTSV